MRVGVIDHFALALTHGLMLLAAWRLLARADFNEDAPTHPAPKASQGHSPLRGSSDA